MKKIIIVLLVGIMNIILFSENVFAFQKNIDNNKGYLVINMDNINKLPDNFRKTTDKLSTDINLEGLSELNASGSAQFAKESLILLKKDIGKRKKITVVDLRQESHGFVNGIAISWRGIKNDLNKGLSYCQVLKVENSLLSSIKLNEPLTFKDGKSIVATSVENENCIVRGEELGYKRIMVTDTEAPTNEAVDDFVHFIKTLPKDTWLHFHCDAGEGRTTTFLAMYDMMKNAKDISFEDIIQRQKLLGGIDLSKDILSRYNLVQQFYQYCKENKDDFNTCWNVWVNSQCQ